MAIDEREGGRPSGATPEYVRLAQLLAFNKQFTAGGNALTGEKILRSVVQDNPDWSISRLIIANDRSS